MAAAAVGRQHWRPGGAAPMSGWEIAGWAALAVLPFWALGAYNRLVALRAAVVAAWGDVGEGVRRREPIATELVRRLREPLSHEHAALDRVVELLAQVRDSAAAARPLLRAHTDAFAAHERALLAAWEHVRERVERHPVPEGAPPLAAMLGTTLDDLARELERVAAARQRFNDAAVVHDSAIAQYPTRLLMPFFGFVRAGRL